MMNFWVKHRYGIAFGIFTVLTLLSIAFLYFEWPSDPDLRYPFSLALIGIGFTAAQFYFQINENIQRKNEELEFQKDLRQLEQNRLDNEFKIQVHKELLSLSNSIINMVNGVLANFNNINIEELEANFMIALNDFNNQVGHYSSIFFQGLDDTDEFQALQDSNKNILDLISEFRIDFQALEKEDLSNEAFNSRFWILHYKWHNNIRKELELTMSKRRTFLERTREFIQ